MVRYKIIQIVNTLKYLENTENIFICICVLIKPIKTKKVLYQLFHFKKALLEED